MKFNTISNFKCSYQFVVTACVLIYYFFAIIYNMIFFGKYFSMLLNLAKWIRYLVIELKIV